MKASVKTIVASAALLMVGMSCFAAGKWNKKKDISVLSREEGSGTRGAFIELFGVEQKDKSGKKVDYTTDEAGITNSTAVMLSSVSGDQYAIGYVSLGSLNDSVKALKIDGVEATVANINNGSYKISRPFNIAVKDDISAVAQDFINYIMSDQGQAVITGNKYIAVANGNSYTSNGSSGKITIAGSSSVSPVMEKLVESYKTVNTNANIEIQTSDSTTGVTSAISGICDIGMASRNLKDSETSKGVKQITIAMDGIAVIVNNNNPLTDLTKDQVKDIFTGNVTNWKNLVK